MWGFPQIRGTLLRVPIFRIVVFGSIWGSILGVPLFWETTMCIFEGDIGVLDGLYRVI